MSLGGIDKAYARVTQFLFGTAIGRHSITFILSSISVILTQRVIRWRHRRALEKDITQHIYVDDDETLDANGMIVTKEANTPDTPAQFDDSLIREFLARNYAFLGETGCERVRNSFVIVVGLGGVGSTAATFLLRSGVSRIRIIDFDQVTLSSLNRHACATLSDVGTPKVIACQKYFNKVAPWIQVDARNELWKLEDAQDLLAGNPDWVVDCIDNIATKTQLLKYCAQNRIKVIASMGAASKADPSRIQIADISTTHEDPLARSVRRKLKMEGIMSGIPVVYSSEKPNAQTSLIPLDEEQYRKGAIKELSALDDFRVRILPCLGPIPAMFGQALATYVIGSIGGARLDPLPVKKRQRVYQKALQRLAFMEQKLTGQIRTDISEEDAEYLIEDLYRARSIVGPAHKIPLHATLCRWREEAPLTTYNCVLFDKDEAERHEKECLLGEQDPEDLWGPETARYVEQKQEEERALRHWRI